MARNRDTFAASVDRFVEETEGAMLAVFQQSTQDLIRLIQTPKAKGGRMPVQSGFLRSSLHVTLNTPHMGFTQRTKGKTYDFVESTVTFTINRANLGDTIYASYAANYAAAREYGTRSSAADSFVRSAASQWTRIVADNVRKIAE